jgi:glycosyltransferase involved in cell wall biosynthesis
VGSGGGGVVKILLALTYFRPYVSGLTIYADRLAQGLAKRGHHVTVLTSRHSSSLSSDERSERLRIVRLPVALRVSKGVIMPTYPAAAVRLARSHDLVNAHLPQLEAAPLAVAARLLRRPYVVTYHCDVTLPPGRFNRVAQRVVEEANRVSGVCADRVVAYTADYAEHSMFLRRFAAKVEIVPPPVTIPAPAAAEVARFRVRHRLADGADGGEESWPVLGLAARFAAEKGIEVVLTALPELIERFPRLKVLFAGPVEDVVGERAYLDRLEPRISALGNRWAFHGSLDSHREMPAFYAALDCLLLPSLNSTESCRRVQVEAMLCGTPVVASALPGVREPIRLTGMGEIVSVGDAAALASAVARVIEGGDGYVRTRAEIESFFDLDRCVDRYEALFQDLLMASGRRSR